MSIKSQKSLNEECSEIFERSYSVRSLSNESLSSEDGDTDSLYRELLRKMSPAALMKLRRCFKRGRQPQHDGNRKVEEAMLAAALQEGVEFPAANVPTSPTDTLWLDEDSFVAAIDEIFGGGRFRSHARQLCVALDPLRSGRVQWSALLARLLPAAPRPHTPALVHKPTLLPHAQRECIVKLVSVRSGDTFCYVCVTRGGRAGVYSGDLKLLSSYEVLQRGAAARRRVRNCWVTDAVYMSGAGCIAYTTSERCVRVFAAAGHAHAHTQLYCISGLPDLPTCAWYSVRWWRSGGALVAGTARGTVCVLQVSPALLQHCADTTCLRWTDVCGGAHRPQWGGRVVTGHAQPVRRLAGSQDGRRLLSCSHDPATSLRLRHSSPQLEDYLVKVQRGVSCFAVSWRLRVVAGGCAGGAVRIWQLAPPAPLARLVRPAAHPLLDVAIITRLQLVLGFHSDCTLNIWDLREETLLQTVKIKFPFIGALGKKLEFGPYCIHPGAPRQQEHAEIEPQQSPSRRGSQIYRGSTGGLRLEDDEASDNEADDDESDPFSVCEVLVSCCSHVCRVSLCGVSAGRVLPPPAAAPQPRTPAHWYLSHHPPRHTPHQQEATPAWGALSTDQTEVEKKHISHLLESAGLQGLLEKDFVLMQGFKNDLNKKLHLMKMDMEARAGAVRCGAPHLALRPPSPPHTHTPRDTLDTLDLRHLTHRLANLSLEFPPASVCVTPSGSSSSTPAYTGSCKP